MTEIEALKEHIESLDKELEDIYIKLWFFRKNQSYAEKYDQGNKQAPKE